MLGTQFPSSVTVSTVRLRSTFAFCLAGFGSAPTMSTDLSPCALVRGNSLLCSAKTNLKVMLCPHMMTIFFEEVFLSYGVSKHFLQYS